MDELFSLLNFLEPNQFKSSAEFLKEFGDLKSEGQVDKLQAVGVIRFHPGTEYHGKAIFHVLRCLAMT